MSERYIFCKRLNRANTRWYWLALAMTCLFAYKSWAQASTPVLIDPSVAGSNSVSNTLLDIQFQAATNDSGKVIVSFENDQITPEFEQSEATLTLHLANIRLAADQYMNLDVSDFGSIVSNIETFESASGSKIEILLADADMLGYDYSYQLNTNSLIIDVSPINTQSSDVNNLSSFSGEPIELDFQDIPVRQVLQIIAKVNGFNLVTTDTVTGNVTLNLSGVPWDQALDMILKIKGLDKRLEGNILLIAPTEELTARETQQLQSKQQVAELAPLRSEHIQINYAKALDIAAILKNSDASILSPRGTASVDERTNTLLVRDTQSSIDEAKALIRQLDIPIRQVLIESRMVTVRDNFDEQLGVRWGISDLQDDTSFSGSLEGADSLSSGEVPDLSDRLNVNLPVSDAAGRLGIQVARLMDGTILDLELSALESENKGEIIASPRITVANQHEAYIEQGTEIPYVEASSSGATSVQFKKAVLSLRVTPHITPDNRIILDLVVTQDSRGETVSTSTGNAVSIDTQEISTQVLVENGETIVLGGIFQQTITDDIAKVPLLGDLPILGNLFKSSQKINDKSELLIFVTPKVLTEDF